MLTMVGGLNTTKELGASTCIKLRSVLDLKKKSLLVENVFF